MATFPAGAELPPGPSGERARAGLLLRCPAALAPPRPAPPPPARPPRPSPPLRSLRAARALACFMCPGPRRPAAGSGEAAAGETREVVAEAQAAAEAEAEAAVDGKRREQARPGPRAAARLQHARPPGAAAAAAPLADRRALLLLALVLAALLRLCGARHR